MWAARNRPAGTYHGRVRHVGHAGDRSLGAPADLVSVGVSPDGRLVYVAGAPEVDASGARRIGAPASLIVFDASDGRIRLIAGALGLEMVAIVP
jgi:hypothetical protein